VQHVNDELDVMRRPRVKAEHAPYRMSGGRIRIGGASYGIAAEINDPGGFVWTLLQNMDGTRGVAEIVDQTAAAHPDQRPPVVRAALGPRHRRIGLRHRRPAGYAGSHPGGEPGRS
jgi:hypothetical protein